MYGFAGGDPINGSDPFGLCPPDRPLCSWIEATSVFLGSVAGFAGGGGAAALAAAATGGTAIPAVPAGALEGGAIGAAAGLSVGKAITGLLMSQNANPDRAGGKSDAEYDRHMRNKGEAEQQLEDLRRELAQTKGPKAQQPIRDQIQQLEESIKGHEKEIRQKWPDGRP